MQDIREVLHFSPHQQAGVAPRHAPRQARHGALVAVADAESVVDKDTAESGKRRGECGVARLLLRVETGVFKEKYLYITAA